MHLNARVGLMAFCLMAFSGCASIAGDPVDRADKLAQAYAPRSLKGQFDEDLARNAMKPGAVEIKSVLVHCYGRGIVCIEGSVPVANTQVFLYPYTPYLEEYLEAFRRLKADAARNPRFATVQIKSDPRLVKYSLAAKTDEFGRYSFKNIRPGKYYIESENTVGHRNAVVHYVEGSSVDRSVLVDSPANLGFTRIVDIEQSSGIYKFESKMNIFN